MASSIIECQVENVMQNQVENVVRKLLDDRAMSIMKGIGKIAAKQGGDSTIQNYRLLGKRTLIALGVAIAAVQVTTTVVGYVVSRKSEEKRIEQAVRRVLEEEREKAEMEAAAESVAEA